MSDSDFNININLDEHTDMIEAQEKVVDAIKKATENAGIPLTVEQWELFKVGQQNATIIFCQLVDKEIEKLKAHENN